jgi:Uma2 family endonuclease
MSSVTAAELGLPLPDHTVLPDRDGKFAENFQEHPQSVLLTDALLPRLQQLYPDGRYAIGQDCGIYWRADADPPESGAVAPDWFFVSGVPATLKGQVRRSYVLWNEWVAPDIVIEFVSGDGAEERDRTPGEGKFWVYERVIRPGFYAIYEARPGRVEVYHLVEDAFERMEPNDRGHYPIRSLGVELGIWEGTYQNLTLPWLRWWDEQGHLLPTGHERAEQEHQRAERLAAKLRSLGEDPEQV